MKINLYKVCTVLFLIVYFSSYIWINSRLLIFAIVLYQIFLLLVFKHNKKMITNSKFLIIIFLISMSLVISLLVNFNISGFVKTFSLIDLLLFTYFIYPKTIVNQKNDYELINVISNVLFIILLFAFITKFNDIKITSGRLSFANNTRHLFGFSDPSIVGFLCFVEFTLTFILMLQGYNKKGRIILLNILKLILSLSMIYLADIRSAMISIIIFIIIYTFYYLPKTKLIFISKIIFITIFSLTSFFYIYNSNIKIENINYILSGRLNIYQKGIKTLINNNSLVFGEGSYRNSDVEVLNRIQLDNSFIDICYQYGIISMVLFIAFIIMILKCILKINKNKAKLDKYDVFIKAYFISVLIYSMFEKNLFSLTSALSFITFSLIFRYIQMNSKNNDVLQGDLII